MENEDEDPRNIRTRHYFTKDGKTIEGQITPYDDSDEVCMLYIDAGCPERMRVESGCMVNWDRESLKCLLNSQADLATNPDGHDYTIQEIIQDVGEKNTKILPPWTRVSVGVAIGIILCIIAYFLFGFMF